MAGVYAESPRKRERSVDHTNGTIGAADGRGDERVSISGAVETPTHSNQRVSLRRIDDCKRSRVDLRSSWNQMDPLFGIVQTLQGYVTPGHRESNDARDTLSSLNSVGFKRYHCFGGLTARLHFSHL